MQNVGNYIFCDCSSNVVATCIIHVHVGMLVKPINQLLVKSLFRASVVSAMTNVFPTNLSNSHLSILTLVNTHACPVSLAILS